MKMRKIITYLSSEKKMLKLDKSDRMKDLILKTLRLIYFKNVFNIKNVI